VLAGAAQGPTQTFVTVSTRATVPSTPSHTSVELDDIVHNARFADILCVIDYDRFDEIHELEGRAA
jgi:hypothetical protein